MCAVLEVPLIDILLSHVCFAWLRLKDASTVIKCNIANIPFTGENTKKNVNLDREKNTSEPWYPINVREYRRDNKKWTIKLAI
jgi:hypothetical protein